MQKPKIDTTAVAMTSGKMLHTFPWKSRQEPICRHCSLGQALPRRQRVTLDRSRNKGSWAADSQHARETNLPDESPPRLHHLIGSEEINPGRASFHMSSCPDPTSTGTGSNTFPWQNMPSPVLPLLMSAVCFKTPSEAGFVPASSCSLQRCLARGIVGS